MGATRRQTMWEVAFVAVVVLGGLGLLWTALTDSHPVARNPTSMNNLKQFGLAMHNYLSVNQTFPPDAIRVKDGKALLSWRVAILPYLEPMTVYQDLYEEFHLDEPWDSAHNRKLINRMPDVYKYPFAPNESKTHYLAIVGKHAAIGRENAWGPQDIADGLSNTILVVESDHEVIWTKPEDLDFDVNNPQKGVGTLRPGGFNVLFADGSVRTLVDDIDADLLKGLMTRHGGENAAPP